MGIRIISNLKINFFFFYMNSICFDNRNVEIKILSKFVFLYKIGNLVDKNMVI